MRSSRNGSAECCVRDELGTSLLLLFIADTLCYGLWMKVQDLVLFSSSSSSPFALSSHAHILFWTHSDTKTRGLHLMRSIFGRLLICFSLRKAKCQVRSKNHKMLLALLCAVLQSNALLDSTINVSMCKRSIGQNYKTTRNSKVLLEERRLLDAKMTAKMELEMKLKLNADQTGDIACVSMYIALL